MTQRAALLLLLMPLAWAQTMNQPSEDSTQKERVHQLEDSMLAPCCWAESVAVHRSEIAVRMRLEIAKSVSEGKTDREILDHYKSIYGARIMREPEGGARLLVYMVPAIASIAGLLVVLVVIRRWLRHVPADLPVHP